MHFHQGGQKCVFSKKKNRWVMFLKKKLKKKHKNWVLSVVSKNFHISHVFFRDFHFFLGFQAKYKGYTAVSSQLQNV